MSTIEVIDDFLSEGEHALLREQLTSNSWPWYKQPWIDIDDDHDRNDITKVQFAYYFYTDHAPVNSGFTYLTPFLLRLRPLALIRIKANLQPRTETILHNRFHCDVMGGPEFTSLPCKHVTTAIYYLETNNGRTIFESGEEVASVANRLVKFPNHLRHYGTTCTDQKIRIVLNFNYVASEEIDSF
jgi:hypothetical protein